MERINYEYPIIWKKEFCLRGECSDAWDNHWWSIPFSSANGLCAECFHCHKVKFIKVA